MFKKFVCAILVTGPMALILHTYLFSESNEQHEDLVIMFGFLADVIVKSLKMEDLGSCVVK